MVDSEPTCSHPGHSLGFVNTPTPTDAVSQKNACINNLRQIDGAKEQWALENKKVAGAVPAISEVDQNIRGGHPKCPAGGAYSYNLIDQKPTCSIPGHEF